jgi:hypothetical protein
MTTTFRDTPSSSPETLATLAEYLELSLDKGCSFLVVRSRAESSALYVGDAGAPREEWTSCGTIGTGSVNAMLEATQSGRNDLVIGVQTYRFMRTFTQVGDHGAVVFTPV